MVNSTEKRKACDENVAVDCISPI